MSTSYLSVNLLWEFPNPHYTPSSLSATDPKASIVYDFFLPWIGEWAPSLPLALGDQDPSLVCSCSVSYPSTRPPGPMCPS